jgi:hypothetical protein
MSPASEVFESQECRHTFEGSACNCCGITREQIAAGYRGYVANGNAFVVRKPTREVKKDLLGVDFDFGAPIPTLKSRLKKVNPMVVKYGPGPVSRRCKHCFYLDKFSPGARSFWKCEARGITRSSATDHRANWETCSIYKGEKMRHELKIWPDFFFAVEEGVKNFEIRKNDRDFKVGDEVLLMEYDPESKVFFGGEILGEITYVTDFMQPQGYVVFQWKRIKKHHQRKGK